MKKTCHRPKLAISVRCFRHKCFMSRCNFTFVVRGNMCCHVASAVLLILQRFCVPALGGRSLSVVFMPCSCTLCHSLDFRSIAFSQRRLSSSSDVVTCFLVLKWEVWIIWTFWIILYFPNSDHKHGWNVFCLPPFETVVLFSFWHMLLMQWMSHPCFLLSIKPDKR